MSTEPVTFLHNTIPAQMLRKPQPLVPHQAPQQRVHLEFTSTERVWLSVAFAIGVTAAIIAVLCLVF